MAAGRLDAGRLDDLLPLPLRHRRVRRPRARLPLGSDRKGPLRAAPGRLRRAAIISIDPVIGYGFSYRWPSTVVESQTMNIERPRVAFRPGPVAFEDREFEVPTMKLYVGNFPHDMTEDALRELFTPFGTPDSVTVITDRMTGQAKGFGFVEFS